MGYYNPRSPLPNGVPEHLARMNNRTHRKLLVVDGQVGFTGGVGIADNWAGNADSPKHWRDSHYRIEGPAVAQMQAAFLDNWIKTTGAVLQGEGYFPALESAGDAGRTRPSPRSSARRPLTQPRHDSCATTTVISATRSASTAKNTNR